MLVVWAREASLRAPESAMRLAKHFNNGELVWGDDSRTLIPGNVYFVDAAYTALPRRRHR